MHDPVPHLIDRGPASVPLVLPEHSMRPLVRELTAAIVKEIQEEDQAAAAAASATTPSPAAPASRARRSLRNAS